MVAMMLTLTEFLLARIAEDEAAAKRRVGTGFERFEFTPHVDKAGGRIGWWLDDWNGTSFIDVAEHIARHDPARVLAECEAKRRIVKKYAEADANESVTWDNIACGEWNAYEYAAKVLALPYADHPDWREEWRW